MSENFASYLLSWFEDCCSVPKNAKYDGYGPAIEQSTICISIPSSKEDARPGEMWVGNGEYGTQVNYCPFCGKKAEVQIKG